MRHFKYSLRSVTIEMDRAELTDLKAFCIQNKINFAYVLGFPESTQVQIIQV